MKKQFQFGLLLTGLFAVMTANSQMNNGNDKAVRQLKLLLNFKGLWESGSAIMKTEGKEYKFAYYADFKIASQNNAIVMHEWATIPGMGKLDGNNLAGVNMSDSKIHWFSVDNMGATHEHIGEFSDERHFTMVFQGVQDGNDINETLEIEFPKPDVLNLKEVVTISGQETVLVTGTFHRKKG